MSINTVNITGSSSSSSNTMATYPGTGINSIPSITAITTNNTGGIGGLGGGGGGAGMVYTTGTGGVGKAWSPMTTGKTVFRTNSGDEISVEEIVEIMKILKERLLILTPAFEKHEKYAALKKAYENYKLIEALIQEENKNDK
jgi:hypothetical protein